LRLTGQFIRSTNGLRADVEAAKVEARVFAFFGFALALGIPDATSSWSPAIAIPVAFLAFTGATPFLWYGAWYALTLLGFARSQPQASNRDHRRRCVVCRGQCRLAAARLEALIARVEASLYAGAAGGSSASVRRVSRGVEDAVLSDYVVDYECWVLDILAEAWRLGASIPRSVRSRLAGQSVGDLKVLSVVLRELEDELGEIAATD
jgi:hypothetical protein